VDDNLGDGNLITLHVQEGSLCPYITTDSAIAVNIFNQFIRLSGVDDNLDSVDVYPTVGVISHDRLIKLVGYLEQLSFKVRIIHHPIKFFWDLYLSSKETS
jgi:hypothetical protein